MNIILVNTLLDSITGKEFLAYSREDTAFKDKLLLAYTGLFYSVAIAAPGGYSRTWCMRIKNNPKPPRKVLMLHPDFNADIYPQALRLARWNKELGEKQSTLRTFLGFIGAYPEDFLPTISRLPAPIQEQIRGSVLPEQPGLLPPGHEEAIYLIHQQIALDLLAVW